MRAAVIHRTGGPEVLNVEEVPRPEPAEGEVLIKVAVASVNPIDWKYRRGVAPRQLPAVLGSDVAGTVELSRTDGFAEGDRVFGFAASGGYAEFATARAGAIAQTPAGVADEQAAAIPVAGLTAWQVLFERAQLQAGQTVLIAGAAGGVGHFAVQFARIAKARVIGIGSAHNREFVLGLGAEEYVDYTRENVAEAVSEVDVAFDAVGGETTETLLSTVREGGILITIAAAPPETAAAERNVRAELHVTSPNPEQMSEIAELIARGEVRVEIAERLPLTDVRRAHELSEGGHTRGKIVLTITD
jgi:NADPH:quinone reductase-like Zn-dependent oxidoreductase